MPSLHDSHNLCNVRNRLYTELALLLPGANMRLARKYKLKWLVADFLFISDMLANSIWGQKYYAIFAYWGISADATNCIISILELLRILMLLYQKHHPEDN